MEFVNAIFSRGINLSLLRLKVLSGFYLHFSVLFLFYGFFCRTFKTREEYGFFLNPPVEGTVNSMEQKTRVKLMSKNSISGFAMAMLFDHYGTINLT
jgi:hypothetical protein